MRADTFRGRIEKGAEIISEWDKVIRLAAENGFIIEAYGGTAIIASHEEQRREFGEDEFNRIQEMNRKRREYYEKLDTAY